MPTSRRPRSTRTCWRPGSGPCTIGSTLGSRLTGNCRRVVELEVSALRFASNRRSSVRKMSGKGRYLFTSESVTEGHPDKIADQISDSILDAILAQDPVGRVACETLVTTGLAMIAGEITTSCYVDFPSIVRETIKDVGYR